MYAYLDPNQDPNDPSLAHRQDFQEPRFEEDFPELTNNPQNGCEEKKKKKKIATPKVKRRKQEQTSISQKTNKCMSSYVKTKYEGNGHRLIKIKIYDLIKSPQILCENDGASVVAQYVVTELFDDILDQTETLVNKISKRLCNDNNL